MSASESKNWLGRGRKRKWETDVVRQRCNNLDEMGLWQGQREKTGNVETQELDNTYCNEVWGGEKKEQSGGDLDGKRTQKLDVEKD